MTPQLRKPVSASTVRFIPSHSRRLSMTSGISRGSRTILRHQPQLRLDCSPAMCPFSHSTAETPFCARNSAVLVPMMPPPTITTSARAGRLGSDWTGSTRGAMGSPCGELLTACQSSTRALASAPVSRCCAGMAPPRLRVASDVGGSFTDNLAYDEAAKRVTVAKVPTTPENRALGTVRGLQRALALQGRGGGDVGYVGHGMTTATNAVIQRRGGRTAFVTNE